MDAPGYVQKQQVILDSAEEVRQQDGCGQQLENNSESPSYVTKNVITDEVRSEEHGDLDSVVLEVDGGTLADKVLDELPQSFPVSGGLKQAPDSLAKGAEKGVSNVQKAPWVSLFRDNRNLGKGIKLDVVES